jgi:hypothetical protein
MKNKFRFIGALALAALATSAFAGLKLSYPVSVDSTSRVAWGSMGSARNSADAVQYIGCSVNTSTTGTYGICEARSPANSARSCSTTNADMLAAIRMVNEASFIFFTWDANSNCTQVSVVNWSFVEPMLQ